MILPRHIPMITSPLSNVADSDNPVIPAQTQPWTPTGFTPVPPSTPPTTYWT